MNSSSRLRLLGVCSAAVLAACGGGDSDIAAPQAPLIDSIVVQGGQLVPPFDASITRYSLIAQTSDIALSVSSTASPSGIQIDGESAASGVAVSIGATDSGQLIPIEVADGQRRQQIEIVAVPADYPVFDVTTRRAGTAPGELYISAAGQPSFSIRTDDYGVPSYLYQAPLRTGTFMRHPNGYSSFADRFVSEFGLETNYRVILNQDLQEIARLQTAAPLQHTDGHDFLITDEGNYVFLAYEPTVRDSTPYRDSVIQEVDSDTGLELFRWNSWDSISIDDVLHNNRIEYAHINSVFVDSDGHFLASLRGTSQIVKIDRQSGATLWKLGGLSNEFVIDDPLGGPCGQHNVTRLANGNILFFDNGIYCPPDYPVRGEISRAVEYEIDESAKTARLAWSYQQPGVYARTGGSAQRLANGNTLIGWGANTTGPSATEVDANGEVVYEFKLWRGDIVRGSNRVLRY